MVLKKARPRANANIAYGGLLLEKRKYLCVKSRRRRLKTVEYLEKIM